MRIAPSAFNRSDLATIIPESRLFNNSTLGENECLNWNGYVNAQGYGRITLTLPGVGQSGVATHRLAWIFKRGIIPDGLCVLHKCDNPTCINPDHLFIGDKKINNDDAMKKGRHFLPFGLKLSKKDVSNIFRRLSNGETQTSLAKEFGVDQSRISQIVNTRHRKQKFYRV